jgi:fructokinase
VTQQTSKLQIAIVFLIMTTGARRVFCIGETVLDIIFREDQPISATPGGSMLNSAVSLGRAGIPVYLISDYAKDHAGDLVHNFLLQNKVSTEFISRYTDGQTALALAFLDPQQRADYSFYRIFPENRLMGTLPATQPNDVVLFGSFYALTRSLRLKLVEFIRSARSNGAFILYDPNFRRAHIGELAAHIPLILENISMASLVRGSDEDFKNIFSADDANEAYDHISSAGCKSMVYTKSGEYVQVLSPGFSRSFKVPPLCVVSTIGAGDAFNAGMIFAMFTLTGSHTLTGSWQPAATEWDHLVDMGIRFAADVCQSHENYISRETANLLNPQLI